VFAVDKLLTSREGHGYYDIESVSVHHRFLDLMEQHFPQLLAEAAAEQQRINDDERTSGYVFLDPNYLPSAEDEEVHRLKARIAQHQLA
jgi:hypothetical protein